MSNIIGLDFETYGDVDLPAHGADRYFAGKHFRPTLACTYGQDRDGQENRRTFDFVQDYFASAQRGLLEEIEGKTIAAHNAPFEQGVLKWLGHPLSHRRFIDSAVVARAAGAGSRLEAAAPQLLGVDKMAEGRDLIKLFAIPGKLQEANDSLAFDPDIVTLYPVEWQTFTDYCSLDAELGWRIVDEWSHVLGPHEHEYAAVTSDMNDVGWPVDLDSVAHMQRRYAENMEAALIGFYRDHQMYVDEDKRLNFNSFKQLKEFCEARGVKARSFDEDHVAKLMAKITERIQRGNLPLDKRQQLDEVFDMLETKQILGGSSLKKLQKIVDLVGEDGRLRGQYLHVGAGQTLRTSGKGVQMQNLKRLTDPLHMELLYDPRAEWTNEDLAVNLRQVFTSSHPNGALIVGDFASVESRKLAYWTGAQWKVDAYAQGQDMYKVLATKIYPGVAYDAVTKSQRQTGKVGELSCGYGAGPGAVESFAAGMGVAMTNGEATELVMNWREANPEVVAGWEKLNTGLRWVVEAKQSAWSEVLANGLTVYLRWATTPDSLRQLNPHAQSVEMIVRSAHSNEPVMKRLFHGCYMRGRDVCYYKPTDRKTGDLWVNHYRHPKSKEIVFFKLYGGKLAGILTQSLCREMFFHSLKRAHLEFRFVVNVDVIGQFHDEIVLDWRPATSKEAATGNTVSLGRAKEILEQAMTDVGPFKGFPLAADIKHDYRYTK